MSGTGSITWTTRRKFFASGAAALSGLMLPRTGLTASTPKQIQVRVNPQRILGRTPDDFLGFGYEISSVAVNGLLSPNNRKLLQYYRTLGSEGVVRIGGNTSDFSIWSPDGQAVSSPKGTVTNRAVINDLGAFVRATGWKLIWGLNLGNGTAESAADQALAVAAAVKDRLLCFQIGNEPDLFVGSGHRAPGYNYADYHREFSRFASELRKRLPGAPIGGPDAAGATNWVASFAEDEGKAINLLTHHYYRAGQKQPAATLGNLLHTDPRFVRIIQQLRQDSHRFGLPYRLVELNSFSGGGKPNVSNTFTSALWALDLMFTLASADGAGLNLETGVNQLGFVSSYSPMFDDGQGNFSARPSYYALLAFSLAGKGQRLETTLDAGGVNLTAYAVMSLAGHIWLTLINKDVDTAVEIDVTCSSNPKSAQVLRLTAPNFDSKSDVKLAGAEVSADGHWKPTVRENLKVASGRVRIHVPQASAALVQLR